MGNKSSREDDFEIRYKWRVYNVMRDRWGVRYVELESPEQERPLQPWELGDCQWTLKVIKGVTVIRNAERWQARDRWGGLFDAKVWVGDVGGDGIIDIGSHGAQLHVRELAEIHRQADPEFKAMLNAVRHGVVTADIAKILNDTGARTPPDPTADETPIITLATRNDIVNNINRRHLDALPGRSQTAAADINGDFGRGDAYPADAELKLKIGCVVILMRNLNPKTGLCNGTRLIVKGIGEGRPARPSKQLRPGAPRAGEQASLGGSFGVCTTHGASASRSSFGVKAILRAPSRVG